MAVGAPQIRCNNTFPHFYVFRCSQGISKSSSCSSFDVVCPSLFLSSSTVPCKMSQVMRKRVLAICEQQRCRSACASEDRFSRDLAQMIFAMPEDLEMWPYHLSASPCLADEPRHDKTNKLSVRPAKIQISMGIRPVWSESSLPAWRKLGSLATHWAQAKTDQTGRMPRLIWVFAGRTATLLVWSWGSSDHYVLRLHPGSCRKLHYSSHGICLKCSDVSDSILSQGLCSLFQVLL